MIGPGESKWSYSHIADLVDAYIILLDQLLAVYGPNAKPDAKPSPYLTTGREGYYFTEDGQVTGRQVSEKNGEILYKKGVLKSPNVTSFPDDEIEDALFGPLSWVIGCQSNSKAERLSKFGWKPHRPKMLDCVEEQVDAVPNATKH